MTHTEMGEIVSAGKIYSVQGECVDFHLFVSISASAKAAGLPSCPVSLPIHSYLEAPDEMICYYLGAPWTLVVAGCLKIYI